MCKKGRNFEENAVKRLLATALVSLTALGTVYSGAWAGSMIEEGRNFPNLNDANIMKKAYIVDAPSESATEFDFRLKGYVFGIRMIKADYKGYFDGAKYAVYTDLKTSGLGAMLKKLEIWAVTRGSYTRSDLVPDFHIQQNMNKKNRRVEMNYNNRSGYVHTAIVPPNGSFGTPPATKAQAYESDDAISALLNMLMRGHRIDADVCSGSVPVYDSKQHYNLRMEKAGRKTLKFNGEKVDTLRCHVYYEPIAGFDPEDLPDEEEGSTPINVYLMDMPELGLSVPIRFTYKISSIKAVIKLDSMRYKNGNGLVELKK